MPHYSYKNLLLASALLLFLLGGFAAHAAEYTIDNVVVDASGTDASDARSKALAQGEATAFRQLINGYNIKQGAEILARTTPTQISNMIRGYEVLDEKIAPDHYHATLRYTFQQAQISALIGNATPVASDVVARPRKAVLVLPIYNDGRTLKLWQDDNKWRQVWYESALEAGGGLVVVPLGDLDDRVDVNDTNVETSTAASLKRMYDHYGVGKIYILSAFYNLKADPKPTLEVSVKKLGDKEETAQLNYTIRSTETLDTLLVRASTEIAKLIYKQQTIDPTKIEYDRLKEITARMSPGDMNEWQVMRKHLLAQTNIVSIRFNSISFSEASMTITYRGTMDILGKTLVASGLRVIQDGDTFILALR